jgi:septal ring factor EnvC (AmiA/AmiB activator)
MDDRLRNVEIHLGRVEQPVELEKVRWAQEQMARSLDAVHDAQRELAHAIDERKQEIKAARDERQLQIQAIEDAREAHEKEQRLLNLELRDRDDQRKAENRRNLYVLAGVFLAAVGQVLSGLIGGPTP